MSALPVMSLDQWRGLFPDRFDDEPMPAASADGYGYDPTPLHDSLIAEVERLRGENERLQAELARSRSLNGVTMRVMSNPSLRVEAWTLIRATMAAEAAWGAMPEAQRPSDGFVRVSIAGIIHANVGAASRSEDSASKHLARAAEWGLLDREIRIGSRAEETVNTATGEVIVRHKPVKQQYIRAGGDVLAALERLASFQRPKPSNHGGARLTCDRCGSAQIELMRHCRGCGAVSFTSKRPDPAPPPEPDAQPSSEPVPASCGYGEQPGGERASARPSNDKAASCGYGDGEPSPEGEDASCGYGDETRRLTLLPPGRASPEDDSEPRCVDCDDSIEDEGRYRCAACRADATEAAGAVADG